MRKRDPIAVTPENRDELRYRCKTDLFFLTRDILGYDKLLERVHRPMAQFFVQKRPALPIEEQDDIKKRMLLYPRFSYKSTLDVGDTIQWLCCFPDIVIFLITAGAELGNTFVEEVQGHLTKSPEDKPMRLLEQIFPELCVPEKEFLMGKYWHPAMTRISGTPSLFALSPGKNISGFHCRVMKEDDCVNNKNSRTMNGIVNTRRDLAVTRDMLDPDGYNDRVGTPYNPLDSNMQDLRTMIPGEMKVMRAPAWKVKESAKWKLKDWPINHPLPEEDYELLFPEKLSYRFLCSKMAENFPNFCAQYLIDPQGAAGITFTEEMLQAATVSAKSIKPYGDTKIIWVLRGDAVAGVVALYERDRMAIVDQIEGRFLPSQLVNRIVNTSKKWGAHEVKMIKTSEAVSLEDEIRGACYRAGWTMSVSWIDEQPEGQVMSAIKGLEAQMSSRRLIFADDLPALGMLYDHFQQYSILDHKEIAEGVAVLARWLPRVQAAPDVTSAMVRQQRAEALRKLQDRERNDQVYGLGRYATPEPVLEEPKKELKEERHGLDDVLGGLTG